MQKRCFYRFLEAIVLDLHKSQEALYCAIKIIKHDLLNRFLTSGRGHARDIDYRDISRRVAYTVYRCSLPVFIGCFLFTRKSWTL